MQGLVRDLSHGWRTLARRPGLAVVVVLTLALGIAANACILSVASAVFLRPLPYDQAHRLFMLFEHYPKGDLPRLVASYPNYQDWYERSRDVFQELAAATLVSVSLVGENEPQQLRAGLVSASMFQLLGARPQLGRTFRPEEDHPPLGQPVALLSYGLWKGHFGGDQAVVGKSIRLSGQVYTVLGVMPAEYHDPVGESYGVTPDIWLPLTRWPVYQRAPPGRNNVLEVRSTRYLSVLARLKPAVTVEQASRRMDTIAAQIAAKHPDTNQDTGAILVPLRGLYFERVERPVMLLLIGAAVLLLIVCANVANLFTVSALARSREVSTRLALGASRLLVVRQFLLEGLLLAVLGGLAGIALAAAVLQPLLTLSPIQLPAFARVSLDVPVLAACVAVSVLASALFSLIPALHGTNVPLGNNLWAGRSPGLGRGATVLRRVLIVVEVGLTVVLLVAAGLLAKTLRNLRQADVGFPVERGLTLRVDLQGQRYADETKRAFVRQAVERMQNLPGVTAAAVWSPDPPGRAQVFTAIIKEGGDPRYEYVVTRYRVVSPGALTRTGIPLLSGRDIDENDGQDKPWVVVVSSSLADYLWPGEDAIGKRIDRVTRPAGYTVVGVVGDVQHQGHLFPDPNPKDAYFSYEQETRPDAYFVVRAAAADPAFATAEVREVIRQMDAGLPVHEVATLSEIVARETLPARFASLLSALFALLALGLASLGLYGVLAYAVRQRTSEFGIRMALGAKRGDIFRLVLREGSLLAAAGVVLGVIAALSVSQFMSSLLFGVSAADPLTYVSILALLALVVLTACCIPARAATRVDPLVALRRE